MSADPGQIAVTPQSLLAAAAELRRFASEQQEMHAAFADVGRALASGLAETAAGSGVSSFASRWNEALQLNADGMCALAVALEEAAAAYQETERHLGGGKPA